MHVKIVYNKFWKLLNCTLENKLEIKHAMIGLVPFIKLNKNHGMTSNDARNVFQKDGSEVIF